MLVPEPANLWSPSMQATRHDAGVTTDGSGDARIDASSSSKHPSSKGTSIRSSSGPEYIWALAWFDVIVWLTLKYVNNICLMILYFQLNFNDIKRAMEVISFGKIIFSLFLMFKIFTFLPFFKILKKTFLGSWTMC